MYHTTTGGDESSAMYSTIKRNVFIKMRNATEL